MSTDKSHRFLRELDRKLWSGADRLRANLDLLKCVSDSLAIRGIDFSFGKEPANSFTGDQHDDFAMANPSLKISGWWDATLDGDSCWGYITRLGGRFT